jgi:hypothetical protein
MIAPFAVVLIAGIFSTGLNWDIRRLDVGETLTTEDALFEYRLDIRNNGQDNARFRLYAKNLQTEETVTISFDARDFRLGRYRRPLLLVRHSLSPAADTHQYMTIEPTDAVGIYEVTLLVQHFPHHNRHLSDARIGNRTTVHQWSFYADFNSGEISNPQVDFRVLFQITE